MLRIVIVFLVVSFSVTGVFAKANTYYANDLVSKMRPHETEDLTALLMSMQLESYQDPVSKRMVQRVVKVAPGSGYERLGVKTGDIILNGSSKKSGNTLELKSQLKSQSAHE